MTNVLKGPWPKPTSDGTGLGGAWLLPGGFNPRLYKAAEDGGRPPGMGRVGMGVLEEPSESPAWERPRSPLPTPPAGAHGHRAAAGASRACRRLLLPCNPPGRPGAMTLPSCSLQELDQG